MIRNLNALDADIVVIKNIDTPTIIVTRPKAMISQNRIVICCSASAREEPTNSHT